ncbi:MAG: signal recognition particle-docking protein FtsY [Candidatus Thermoplasmatota archaeon]
MGLFDSLRSKLKGVSKKLEDEVEKQLGDKLEQELAAAVAKEQPKPVPSPPPVVAPVQPPVAPPVAPAPEVASPAPVAPEPKPVLIPAAAPPAPANPAPTPRPIDVEPTTHLPPPAPKPQPSPTVAPAPPVPASAPLVAPTAPVAVLLPAKPAEAPKPTPKPQPAPQPGKKLLSEAEIEARLLQELQQSVQVQKEVEQVVVESAPAARFTINESILDDILWDLEVGLLESDVALPVIEAIKKSVREQLLSLTIGGRPEEIVEKVLRTAIKRVLSVNPVNFDDFVRAKMAAGKKPVVIMFVGVNGTGKTTSIGRLAWRLKEQGISCCLAAGDTFRAGAIEQLALHGERVGVSVIQHKAGADPAAVAYDAIEHAKARNKSVVLLDTAGRMQNNRSLMDEMDKVRRVANPDLVIFVGDSLAGNDAVEQARKFDEIVDIGGVILTKVDVDAKGGAALSVAYTINKPLLFVGVGQNYPDLKPFDADWLVNRLFGDEPADKV